MVCLVVAAHGHLAEGLVASSAMIVGPSDDVVAVPALVAAGFGVTLLSALALAGHRNPGVVTHPVVGAARELHVATYGAPPRPAAVEEVVQTLLGLSWIA